MANFQERFNKLKVENNLSLEDIAKKINLTKSSLSRIINGKSPLRYDLVVSLASIFDVSISYLIGESNSKSNKTC